ncbi:MAG: hypothetical protein NC123_00530 [Butyrivibrio sp.]|nr:hypothetical protein [Acetatifactor muris]MCM1558020.1 hypothetical protein [Butyrivibrio sp.]
MPDIILRILAVIGIVFLILLGLALLLLLLVLFWPVTYRVKGEKTSEKLWVTAKADWLFGVVRVRYAYPEPGKVAVKLLWKTLGVPGQKKETPGEERGTGERQEAGEKQEAEAGQSTENEQSAENAQSPENEQVSGEKSASEAKQEAEGRDETVESKEAESGTEETEEADLKKIQKIKYTILKIYDKIKEIWANITYYAELLREEDTRLLWEHVKLRFGKILKNIRPRHIRADVLFGTGSPDTTGYAFGIYGMLLPVFGRNVCVTPDFSRAVLEGNADVSGHITLYTLAWNALKLLLDRKLKLFIKKMKAGRKENGR